MDRSPFDEVALSRGKRSKSKCLDSLPIVMSRMLTTGDNPYMKIGSGDNKKSMDLWGLDGEAEQNHFGKLQTTRALSVSNSVTCSMLV